MSKIKDMTIGDMLTCFSASPSDARLAVLINNPKCGCPQLATPYELRLLGDGEGDTVALVIDAPDCDCDDAEGDPPAE